jgi:preprotein translocase subunit SecA
LNKTERDRKKLQPYADRINSLEPIFKNRTPEEMLSKNGNLNQE